MQFPSEHLFRLATKALDWNALQPVIAVLVLYFMAMFVDIGGKLDDSQVLLYWLCFVIAIITGIIGLGGAGLYAWRMLFPIRRPRPGRAPTPD
jgi:hypothetical protein